MSRQSPEKLSEKLEGEYEERKEEGIKKLLHMERHCAENTTAKINEYKLDREYETHNEKEKAISCDPRKQIKAVAAAVEAICNR